jgi:predicted RNase H-like nuclease
VLVALDQPTIVRNEAGSRPVDKIAGSLISWLGGGVQPANRSKVGMFDDNAPIWAFLADLAAAQSPEEARSASSGRHLIEVFPALALAALHPAFCGRKLRPRYNPERRKTFKIDDWRAVLRVVTDEARRLGCHEAANWVGLQDLERARKQNQDCLDALICLLVGLRWRLEPRARSAMLGCLDHGYMIAPITPVMHERLSTAASLRGVPIDNILSSTGIRA